MPSFPVKQALSKAIFGGYVRQKTDLVGFDALGTASRMDSSNYDILPSWKSETESLGTKESFTKPDRASLHKAPGWKTAGKAELPESESQSQTLLEKREPENAHTLASRQGGLDLARKREGGFSDDLFRSDGSTKISRISLLEKPSFSFKETSDTLYAKQADQHQTESNDSNKINLLEKSWFSFQDTSNTSHAKQPEHQQSESNDAKGVTKRTNEPAALNFDCRSFPARNLREHPCDPPDSHKKFEDPPGLHEKCDPPGSHSDKQCGVPSPRASSLPVASLKNMFENGGSAKIDQKDTLASKDTEPIQSKGGSNRRDASEREDTGAKFLSQRSSATCLPKTDDCNSPRSSHRRRASYDFGQPSKSEKSISASQPPSITDRYKPERPNNSSPTLQKRASWDCDKTAGGQNGCDVSQRPSAYQYKPDGCRGIGPIQRIASPIFGASVADRKGEDQPEKLRSQQKPSVTDRYKPQEFKGPSPANSREAHWNLEKAAADNNTGDGSSILPSKRASVTDRYQPKGSALEKKASWSLEKAPSSVKKAADDSSIPSKRPSVTDRYKPAQRAFCDDSNLPSKRSTVSDRYNPKDRNGSAAALQREASWSLEKKNADKKEEGSPKLQTQRPSVTERYKPELRSCLRPMLQRRASWDSEIAAGRHNDDNGNLPSRLSVCKGYKPEEPSGSLAALQRESSRNLGMKAEHGKMDIQSKSPSQRSSVADRYTPDGSMPTTYRAASWKKGEDTKPPSQISSIADVYKPARQSRFTTWQRSSWSSGKTDLDRVSQPSSSHTSSENEEEWRTFLKAREEKKDATSEMHSRPPFASNRYKSKEGNCLPKPTGQRGGSWNANKVETQKKDDDSSKRIFQALSQSKKMPGDLLGSNSQIGLEQKSGKVAADDRGAQVKAVALKIASQTTCNESGQERSFSSKNFSQTSNKTVTEPRQDPLEGATETFKTDAGKTIETSGFIDLPNEEDKNCLVRQTSARESFSSEEMSHSTPVPAADIDDLVSERKERILTPKIYENDDDPPHDVTGFSENNDAGWEDRIDVTQSRGRSPRKPLSEARRVMNLDDPNQCTYWVTDATGLCQYLEIDVGIVKRTTEKGRTPVEEFFAQKGLKTPEVNNPTPRTNKIYARLWKSEDPTYSSDDNTRSSRTCLTQSKQRSRRGKLRSSISFRSGSKMKRHSSFNSAR
jgi:hypothetical protein